MLMIVCMLVAPRTIEACSCFLNPNPPCRAYGKADVIFEGVVLKLEKVKPDTEIHLRRRAEIKIKNVYKGTAEKITYVYTGDGASDCGYRFKVGKRYLIYANRSEGLLTTFKCGRNQEVKYANDDIAYIQSRPSLISGISIYGRVEKYLLGSGYGNNKPIEGSQIQIDGPERRDVTTDSNGKFSVTGLPVGRYSVKAIPPPGLRLSANSFVDLFPSPLFEEDIPDKGCLQADFVFEPGSKE